MDLLDMGCGPYAVLARFVQSRWSCASITAVDHCAELVDFARQHDASSGITYLCSDLFEAVKGRYDLIVFNAPYLVEEKGNRLGLIPDDLSRKRFSGGNDGAATIRRFLTDCPRHLKQDGLALLGVNHYHISEETLQTAIYKSGLQPVDIRFNAFSKACVYVLREKSNAQM